MLKRLCNGDTVVELLFAFAIFSLAAVSTIVLLNQGIAVSQRSMEKGLVRQQIDSQAEMLRYAKETNDPAWKNLIANFLVTNPMALARDTCPAVAELGARSFFLTRDSAGKFVINTISAASGNYTPAATYAKIDYTATNPSANGMWLQVVKAENRSGKTMLDAYDFYIHACWDSVGTSMPMTTGTIVRLYGN